MPSAVQRVITLPSVLTGLLGVVICVFAGCGVATSIADSIIILMAGFGLFHFVRSIYFLGKAHGRGAIDSKCTALPRDIKASSTTAGHKKPQLATVSTPTPERNPSEDFG